jgi:hypothetical protein
LRDQSGLSGSQRVEDQERLIAGQENKNISKKGPLNRRSLGFARDDKGDGDSSMKSSCWAEGAFLSPTQGDEKQLCPATAFRGNAAVPFVIPTRISCHAALDKAACAPFRKEGRVLCDDATKFHRKSGGAKPRDLRFSRPLLEMFSNRTLGNYCGMAGPGFPA